MFTVSLLGSRDEALLAGLRERGLHVTLADLNRIGSSSSEAKAPDAFVVDIRTLDGLPRDISDIRRQYPATGLVVVAGTLDPNQLLEAMRLGANEWVVEPIKFDELVETLRRVARPAAKPQAGRVIAVIGAKGGVGGTTVAVNIATSLHLAAQEPTLLLDLHLAHGDAAVFLGVDPRFSTIDALENIDRLDETYLKGLITSTKAGVDLLGSSTGLHTGTFDAGRVRRLIAAAASMYRFVVLDCPRTDATMLESLDVATQVVVVANQELPTIRAASRIVNGLRQRCGTERVKLAISRMDPKGEIGQADIERVLGAPVKYVFPNDYRTSSQAITRGEPLILQNHSQLASSIKEVARDLAGLPKKQKEAATKAGLFGRLGGRR